mgnify:CR=1 FL=1
MQRGVLHADETTLQVLREPGKTALSKSYMRIYRIPLRWLAAGRTPGANLTIRAKGVFRNNWATILRQTFRGRGKAGGLVAGGEIFKAAGAGKTDSGRPVCVGTGEDSGSKVCAWQGALLSAGTVAAFDPVPEGRASGTQQQPGGAQHQTVCDGPKKTFYSQTLPAELRAAR